MPYGLLASVSCTFLAVAVAAPIGTARQQVSHTEAGPYVNAAMLLAANPNGQEHVNFGKVEPRDDERGWSGRFLGTVVG